MIRLCARRGLDFKEADLLGRWWWTKLKWILDETEQEHVREVLQLRHTQHSAALNYESGDKAFKHHWKESGSVVRQYYNSCFPWMGGGEEEPQVREYDRLRRAWIREFGDTSNEDTQKAIMQTAEEWLEVVRQAEIEAYGRPKTVPPKPAGKPAE